VGFKTRAFVTFGEPIPMAGYRHESRRDVLDLAHRTRDAIGRLYKVLPSAVVAAVLKRSMTQDEVESGVDRLLDGLRAAGANLAMRDARQGAEQGLASLARREIIRIEGDRVRVRDRGLLRYYARTIQHLLPSPVHKD
jgi:hypothetical protein